MATNLIIARDNTFKGYNDTMAPEFLGDKYLADALNCFIRTEEIIKRNGYTAFGSTVAGGNPCQGLKGVRFADGTKRVYAVFGGTVYYWTGSGNFTSLGGTLSTTAYIDIVVANNAVYFFDGANTVVKVNSSNTLSTVAAIPVGKYAKWFHNQLHVAGISGSPNKLKSSEIGDPETFTGGQSSDIDINPNDGDYISGLGTFKAELIVFKTQRVWSISNLSNEAITVADLNEQVTGFGTIAYRSIVNIGNDLLYLGFLGDKPHIRSLKRTSNGVLLDGGVVSTDIETSLNGANKSVLDMTAAIFDGRNAWFAVPYAASSTNNRIFMYDTITKGWVRHTGINAAVWDSFAIGTTPQIYFGEADASGKAYRLDTSTSDNGSAINFQVITRRYGGDQPERKKKWKYFKVAARETGNFDVTVDVSRDGFSYDNLGTLNLSGTGAIFNNITLDTSRLGETDVKKETFNLAKAIATYTQYKLYDNSATSSVTLRNWEVLNIPRHIRE